MYQNQNVAYILLYATMKKPATKKKLHARIMPSNLYT